MARAPVRSAPTPPRAPAKAMAYDSPPQARAGRCSTRWAARPKTASAWRWTALGEALRPSTTTPPSAWRRSSPARLQTGLRARAAHPQRVRGPPRPAQPLLRPGATRPPVPGVKGFIDGAVAAVTRADARLAQLQDSMRPVEVGDAELRAGLSEVPPGRRRAALGERAVRGRLVVRGRTLRVGGAYRIDEQTCSVARRPVDRRRSWMAVALRPQGRTASPEQNGARRNLSGMGRNIRPLYNFDLRLARRGP